MTMNAKQLKAAAAEVFKSHPDRNELFICLDGECFFLEHDARNHERHLGAHWKGIRVISRELALGKDEKAFALDTAPKGTPLDESAAAGGDADEAAQSESSNEAGGDTGAASTGGGDDGGNAGAATQQATEGSTSSGNGKGAADGASAAAQGNSNARK